MPLLRLHRDLLADDAGQQAYRKAISETVRAGQTVLDLGTGTGIHAVFACRAGATLVYAVEQHDFIEVAKRVAAANACADRIHFLQTDIAEVDLPEKVDVILAHHGFPQLFELLPLARDRFLKPGGALIPAALELFVAPLQSVRAYESSVLFWDQPHYGLSFRPVRNLAVNSQHDYAIQPDEILGEAKRLGRFDFGKVQDGMLSASVRFTILRRGTLHGMGIWSEQWLTPQTSISTAPPCSLPASLWHNLFLPIEQPQALEAGDEINFSLNTGKGEWGKLWTWEVTVNDAAGKAKAGFKQSAFRGQMLSKDRLRRLAPDYRAQLTSQGAAVRFVLECCAEHQPVQWIEKEVVQRFPRLFRSEQDAAGLVAKVLAQYSR